MPKFVAQKSIQVRKYGTGGGSLDADGSDRFVDSMVAVQRAEEWRYCLKLPVERNASVEIKKAIIPFEIEQKLIWKHNVRAYEVEEVLFDHPHIRFVAKGDVKGEDLYSALGQTEAGRYLMIFFINKGAGRALVISARDMDAKERKRYDKVR
jgi:uncharacterized DUF497 family protein